MDNSTIAGGDASVAGDSGSIMSVPYKDSRPSTPSQMPLVNPRVPGHISRNESPLRTGSPLGRTEDYFSSRGPHRDALLTPGYTPGFTPSDVYELKPLSDRSCDTHDPTDRASLL